MYLGPPMHKEPGYLYKSNSLFYPPSTTLILTSASLKLYLTILTFSVLLSFHYDYHLLYVYGSILSGKGLGDGLGESDNLAPIEGDQCPPPPSEPDPDAEPGLGVGGLSANCISAN